jgi:hypothetical protein
MAIPKKDSLLAGFSTNFNDRIVASAASYGLTSAQATQYTAVHDPFIVAYNAVIAARDSGTRSSSLVADKDLKKFNLLRYARQLYADVQSSLTVPSAKKIELGVRVRSAPSPRPAPAFAPKVDIVSTAGNTVRIHLHDSVDTHRRGRPVGVDGAAVFSFVGASAPTEEADWRFEGNTTRTVVEILFPAATPPGSKVWFTAWWFNPRALRGPAASPVGVNLPGGAAMAA